MDTYAGEKKKQFHEKREKLTKPFKGRTRDGECKKTMDTYEGEKNNFTHNLDKLSSSLNAAEELPRWPSGRDGLAGLPLGRGHGHLVPSRGREAASRLLHHGLGWGHRHLPEEGSR